jgi:hypothetical protein
MATQPAFLKRTEVPAGTGGSAEAPARPRPALAGSGNGTLRPLPHEDVFFYCKKVDNSRLVREPDPKAGGACWSAIGATCVTLALITAMAIPRVSNVIYGYKLESLKAEELRLLDERRMLELQEAELLSPQRLEKLAKSQNLVTPQAGQVVHLDSNKPDGAVAMVK